MSPSKIGCFSSGSNFAAKIMIEKIVVQSAVDSEHGRVWGVTVIIMGIGTSEVRTVARLLHAVTFREGAFRHKQVPFLKAAQCREQPPQPSA